MFHVFLLTFVVKSLITVRINGLIELILLLITVALIIFSRVASLGVVVINFRARATPIKTTTD